MNDVVKAARGVGMEIWEIFREGWKVLGRRWLVVLSSFLGLTLVLFGVLPLDAELLKLIRGEPDRDMLEVVRGISYWGDFLTGSVPLAILLFVGGCLLKSRKLRRAAMASLLAAALAGVLVNCFRLTLGRPRPSAGLPDGFYGLQASSQYHGFPSGHSATAMGSTMGIAMVYPQVGVPVLILGGSVGWSRMMLNRHHLTDVLAGSYLGILMGVGMGWAARRDGKGRDGEKGGKGVEAKS